MDWNDYRGGLGGMIRREHLALILLHLHRLLFYYIKEFYHLSEEKIGMVLQFMRDFYHAHVNSQIIEELDAYILDLEFDIAVMAHNLQLTQAPLTPIFLPYAEVVR